MSSIRIHTTIESAKAILAVGEIQVSAKWNETSKQKKMERSVNLPFNCLKAPELEGTGFRPLVECILERAAESVLKEFVNENPNTMEIDESLFTRENLSESFMSSGDSWLTKQELEIGFTQSATWKRITSRPEFTSNATYKAQAEKFKDAILKLTGKAVQMEPDQCDKILVKLEDSDLATGFGAFVVKRLTQLKNKPRASDFDVGAL